MSSKNKFKRDREKLIRELSKCAWYWFNEWQLAIEPTVELTVRCDRLTETLEEFTALEEIHENW
jgi:hypothetical protein